MQLRFCRSCWIRPEAIIHLADHANCAMLENNQFRCGGGGQGRDGGCPYSPNITIEGGIWDGNNVNQDRCSRESRFALKEYDPEYYFGICLRIRGMRDFTFRNATISNPESYGIQISGAVYFTVENIFFDYNMKRLNMDGIHMAGPALCANPASGLHESDLRSGLCGILFLYYIIDCGGGAAGDFTGQTT